MKVAILVGLPLIILGFGALAYQEISYRNDEKILDMGSLEASMETTKTIPVPPIVGAVALITGCSIVIASARDGATAA